MSRAVGQYSLTPKGNNNMNFRLARDQVVLQIGKFMSQPASRNDFFAGFSSFELGLV